MRGRLLVLRRVLVNPRLRRVQTAFLGFGSAEYGVWVAVLVYAFQRGGTGMAAAIAVIQLVPAAVVAPLASRVTMRRGAHAVLRGSYLLQSASLTVTGLSFLLHAVPAIGYAGAVVAASAVTLTRPAQYALLPDLVDTPNELTAANAVSGWVESVSLLLGPALAGVLMSVDGPGVAIAVFAGVMLLSAGLVPRLSAPASSGSRDECPEDRSSVGGICRNNPAIAALLGMLFVQFVAIGSLDVIVVVLAAASLSLGASGAGYLAAAFGAGAVVGGFGSLVLVGRRRLATPLLGSAACWGATLLLLSGLRTAAAALGLIAVAGVSRTVLDVAGRTLLHRVVPRFGHGPVFGALEGLSMAGLALGAVLVPALVALGGVASALAGIGGLLLAVTLALCMAVARLDHAEPAPAAQLALLRASPMFAVLAPDVLEDLARALTQREVRPAEEIVREGEFGDRFYLLAAGELVVSNGGRPVAALHPGDGFGEIALLRDGIRTATVTAVGPATVFDLDGPRFLEAMTGSRPAHRAVEELVEVRLRPAVVDAADSPTRAPT